MSRKEALESFKKISDIPATLTMRMDRRNVVENIKEKGGDPSKFLEQCSPDPYPEHSEKDLERILGMELNRQEKFWEEREHSLNHSLFEEGYGWAGYPGLAIKAICGSDPIVLTEDMAEMLILLSEPVQSEYYENKIRYDINRLFENSRPDNIMQLLPVLRLDTLARLIRSLDGERLAQLIDFADCALGRLHKKELVQKIAKALSDESYARGGGIAELGDYCAVRLNSGYKIISTILKRHGGPEGKAVAEQLVNYMKEIFDSLKETLSRLEGEKHD